MKKITSFAAIICLTLLLVNCTKVEKGPKGDTGAAGQNAKVETEVFLVTSTSWSASTDSLQWNTSVAASKVTANIVNNGSMQVFVLKNNVWTSLPFLEEDLYTVFTYAQGVVNLIRSDSHGTYPPRPGTEQYKVVTLSAP
jgi:hypothetical protein